MKYSAGFKKEALDDIKKAVIWYESQRGGLGDEFFISFQASLENIISMPHMFQERFNKVHIAVMNRFPYLIYYTIVDSKKALVILAILHSHADPKTGEQRSLTH